MHTEKFKCKSNYGVMREWDRSLYGREDCTSKSLIDHTRSFQNVNFCPYHLQYTVQELKEVYEEKAGRKMREDAVFGSTIVTLPKDYEGDVNKFFAECYNGLKQIYKIKDSDVISAYVHMDETTPHMHFGFIPTVYEGECTKVNWNKCITRSIYQRQHKLLQDYLSTKGIQANLLNGKTIGVDVNQAKKEDREEAVRLQEEVLSLQKDKKYLENEIEGLKGQIKQYDSFMDKTKSFVKTIEGYFDKWVKYSFDIPSIQRNADVFKSARDGLDAARGFEGVLTRKKIEEVVKEFDRIQKDFKDCQEQENFYDIDF